MSEKYTLVLRSSDTGSSPHSGNRITAKFYVNWSSLLPKEYNKYLVNVKFQSDLYGSSITQGIIVYGDFVKNGYNYDTYDCSRTSLLLIPEVVIAPTSDSVLSQYTGDSSQIMLNYPQENYITITLKEFDGSAPDNDSMIDWVMILTFTPIKPLKKLNN